MAESITRKNIDLDILDYYDGKIKDYVDNKASTGGLTIDDALSDTSTNPVQNKVIKQAIDNKADKTVATTSADGLMSASDKGKLDAFEITATGGKLHDKDIATTDLIPTSLPANGGNADTVDGLHASNFIKNTSDWKSMNFEITYGDHNYPNVIDNNIPIMPKTCNYTHIISRVRSDNSIISILSIPSDYDDDIFLYQSISGVWKNIANGGNADYAVNAGNADTVDDLHSYEMATLSKDGNSHHKDWKLCCKFNMFNDNRFAFFLKRKDDSIGDFEIRTDYANNAEKLNGLNANSFIKTNASSAYDCNTLFDAGLYLCNGSATNTPNNLIYGTLFVMPYRKPYDNAKPDYCAQIFIPNGDAADDDVLWYRTSIENTWNEWKRSCDGGNADTLGGLHADVFLKNTVMQGLATSINDAITPDVYGVSTATPDFPSGYGTWGFLEIRRYGNVCYQTIRFDSGVIINRVKNITSVNWSEWQEIYTSGNKPYVTGTTSYQITSGSMSLWSIPLGFTPSVVICQTRGGNVFFAGVIENGFSIGDSGTNGSGTKIADYIAFK